MNSQHNNEHDDVAELEALLSSFSRGKASSADMARFSALLSESEAARWAFIHAVHLEEGIKRWSRTQGKADVWTVLELLQQSDNSQDTELATHLEQHAMNDVLLARESSANQQLGAARRRSDWGWGPWLRGKVSRQSAAALALAASLLTVLALLQGLPSDAEIAVNSEKSPAGIDAGALNAVYELSDSENVVARVAATNGDVAWTPGWEPQDFLMRFRAGDIVGVETGLFQIEFSAGASLVVESPATLQIINSTSARLIRGRVVGRAENGNFTLLTPTANVVDIGTEFGVGVIDSETDVTVFEGEVHVHSLSGGIDAASMQRLQPGMSVRIDSQGVRKTSLQPNQQLFRRDFANSAQGFVDEGSVSLLDLVSGHDTTQPRIAGSIDPRTGYWGRPPWLDPERTVAQRGDTQFAQSDWNPMIDGVFIPRSNAREMQIDSDGHMVYLPPNSGSTWGPIWARRRFNPALDQAMLFAAGKGYWGEGLLSKVLQRLQQTQDGLLGLHSNVGITFDLNAIRESRAGEIVYFKALVANLDSSPRDDTSSTGSVADLRVFVDGKLRYSRLQFGRHDGEAALAVALSEDDRFLTIVATDAGADPRFDHVVLIDPVLEYEQPLPAPQPDSA